MALYLVQHGLSLPKEQDPEKGLSDLGKAEAARMAEVARDYGVSVKAVRHSGKKRAAQTAEIMAEHLYPPEGVTAIDGIAPLDDVTAFAAGAANRKNEMIVGHLPFMEKLVGHLTAGSADKRVLKFQNGGIVRLDHDPESNAWSIIWTLMPRIG